jgi:hypothetical protein
VGHVTATSTSPGTVSASFRSILIILVTAPRSAKHDFNAALGAITVDHFDPELFGQAAVDFHLARIVPVNFAAIFTFVLRSGNDLHFTRTREAKRRDSRDHHKKLNVLGHILSPRLTLRPEHPYILL